MINFLAPYRKAIVPLIVAVILAGLSTFGIVEGMTVKEAITLIVTSGFVWLIPNRK